MKKSKAQRDADRRFDKNAMYSPRDAIDLVKTLAHASFDESVDASFLLGIDARQADQLVRGTVSLPHGTGKEVRVAVFAESDKAREAEAAGADLVGGKDLADELQGGGALNFDIAIATPDMMKHVGKLGRHRRGVRGQPVAVGRSPRIGYLHVLTVPESSVPNYPRNSQQASHHSHNKHQRPQPGHPARYIYRNDEPRKAQHSQDAV